MDRRSCAYGWRIGSRVLVAVAILAADVGSGLMAVVGEQWEDHPAGEVMELSASNFEEAIATFPHILVDFYAPWCGHCKALAPQLDEAATRLWKNSPRVVIAKLDAEKFGAISNKYKISAYPTLKLFINGIPTDYDGPRKADLIVSFLQRLVAPEVLNLETHSEISEFRVCAGDNLPIIIGFGIEASALSAIAADVKQRAWFVVMKNPMEQTMEEYDFDKKPCLLVLHPKAEERHVFYGPFEGSDFSEIIYHNLLPFVSPLTYETLRFVKEDGRPIALAILEDEDSEKSRNFLNKLKAVIPANRDFVFTSVSAVEWPEFVDTFNVGKSTQLPVLYIWNGELDYYLIDDLRVPADDDVEFGFLKLFRDFRENKAMKHKIKRPTFFQHFVENIGQNMLYIFVFIATIVIFLLSSDFGPRSKNVRTVDNAEEEESLSGNSQGQHKDQ